MKNKKQNREGEIYEIDFNKDIKKELKKIKKNDGSFKSLKIKNKENDIAYRTLGRSDKGEVEVRKYYPPKKRLTNQKDLDRV